MRRLYNNRLEDANEFLKNTSQYSTSLKAQVYCQNLPFTRPQSYSSNGQIQKASTMFHLSQSLTKPTIIQLTLVISNSLISNDRLSRGENPVPALT